MESSKWCTTPQVFGFGNLGQEWICLLFTPLYDICMGRVNVSRIHLLTAMVGAPLRSTYLRLDLITAAY